MARFGSGVGQFRLLPGTTDESFVKNFPTRINGLIECRKTGFIFTPEFQKEVDVIKNFRIRDTDVWVVTFPRSGQSSIFIFCLVSSSSPVCPKKKGGN